MPVPRFHDERGRLEALRALEILDTPREPAFDDITALAAQICGVPIALVSFVDEDRQWFKSCVGLDASETPIAQSFCAHSVADPRGPFIVPDAQIDPRFAENPLVVGAPHIRFYAGVPIVLSSGYPLGTLCVVDREPRTLEPEQLAALERLARLVADQLGARQLSQQLTREGARLVDVSDALAHTERRYRELVEHAQGLICIHQLDGTITMANSATAETLGYPVDAIVGRNLTEFVPSRYRDEFRSYMQQIQHEQRVSGLMTLVCADGRRATLAFRNFRFDAPGKPAVVISHAVEITERMSAEKMNRRIEALVQATPDAICLVEPDGQPILVNRAMRQMLELGPDDPVPDFDVREPAGPDDMCTTGRPLGIAAATGIWEGETTIVGRHGLRTDVSQLVVLSRTRRGRPDFYAVISRDIAERRRAQEAVRRERERLATLVNGLKEVVFETDAVGLWTYLNPAWTEITGFQLDDSIGRPFFEFLHPDDVELNRQRFAPLIAREKEYCRHEIRYRTIDGGFRWIEVHARLRLTPDDQIAGTTGTLRDITEQKAMDAELVSAREEALEASRLKSEFLANMSHEIRTPINGVLGLTTLLMDTPLNPEQWDYVRGVAQSAQALLDVINDVLDLSKIEAGHLDVELMPFEITRLLAQVRETVGVKARLKGLGLEVRCAADLPSVTVGDPGRLRQVLLNLADNAVKFTSVGSVTIDAARHVTDHGEERLRFTVRDTGIGIPASKQVSIFDKFSQADSSTARRFGGTGLGLAICRQLVALMGGSIAVSSVEGEGATFTFDVPLRASGQTSVADPQASTAPRRASGPEAKPKHVLLVEDNPINQMVASRFLAKEGCVVDIADDGPTALERVNSHRYDAIFMDCQLPGMDGYRATQLIRQLQGYEQVPIIGVTAHAMVGDREKCLAAGMTDYLAKPLHPDDLHAALLRAADGLPVRSESGGESQGRQVTEPFDAASVLSALDDDMDGIRELVALFATSLPKSVSNLVDAAERGDANAVAALAHTIRGSVGSVGAVRLAALARDVETTARAGGVVAVTTIASLQKACDELVTALGQWASSLE